MKSEKTRVYITIDTETSLGGAWRNQRYAPVAVDGPIFGKYGSRYYGIPLIMDILEEHGFRGTFFTEVFCSYVLDAGEVSRVFRYIQDRGHDLQLHVHPIYWFYREMLAGRPHRQIDLMFQLSPGEQQDLIGEAVSLFREFSGSQPRAFRAGCYGASETTLRALLEHGIDIDSSYNLAYLDRTCGFSVRPLNAPVVLDGIYEFPVTVFRVAGCSGFKPLEISAVSVTEILTAIRSLRQADCYDVVLMLHSFSLLKNLGVRFDNYRPDGILIQRLRKLCAAFSERSDEIEVNVLGKADVGAISMKRPQFVPSNGWLHPSMRKIVQGVNRLSWT
jgi:hypothetical protein